MISNFDVAKLAIIYKKYFVVVLIIISGVTLFLVFTTRVIVPLQNSVVSNNEVKQPNPNTTYDDGKTVFIDVSGAVLNPGVYEVPSDFRVIDALNKAGGMSNNADKPWVAKNLNLSLLITDTQKIYVPFVWDSIDNKLSISQNISLSADTKEKNDTIKTLNINTASSEALLDLDGIGEKYVQEIFNNRPFENIDDLKNTTALSDTLIDKISTFITF